MCQVLFFGPPDLQLSRSPCSETCELLYSTSGEVDPMEETSESQREESERSQDVEPMGSLTTCP